MEEQNYDCDKITVPEDIEKKEIEYDNDRFKIWNFQYNSLTHSYEVSVPLLEKSIKSIKEEIYAAESSVKELRGFYVREEEKEDKKIPIETEKID